MKMSYMSTFTGCGAFELALEEVFPETECVAWSEIKKSAITTFTEKFPQYSTLNIGDIEKYCFDVTEEGRLKPNVDRIKALPDFDMLFGGSSCQDLSVQTSSRSGILGVKSRVFFSFYIILKIKKPKYFLLENVASMSKKDKKIMTKYVSDAYGKPIEPVMLDSGLLSAQNRKRLYWCNWPIEVPKDRGITFPEIVAYSKSSRYRCKKTGKVFSSPAPDREYYKEERRRKDGKANTLVTGKGCSGPSTSNYLLDENGNERHLKVSEAEVLQGLPIGHTNCVSEGQAFDLIGNAVSVPAVRYIFEQLKERM